MKRPYIISGLLLIMTAIIMVVGFSSPAAPQEQAKDVYRLLVADDTGAFLLQLKRGMNDAAARHKVKWVLEVVAKGAMPTDAYPNHTLVYLDEIPEGLTPLVVIGQEAEGVNCVYSARLENADYPLAEAYDMGAPLIARLEKGEIAGFMAQDPYAMGYLALENAVTNRGRVAVPLTLITKDNMYLKENIRLVFPLLQ